MSGILLSADGLGDREELSKKNGESVPSSSSGVESRILKGQQTFRERISSELGRLGGSGTRACKAVGRFFGKLWGSSDQPDSGEKRPLPELEEATESPTTKSISMEFSTFADAVWSISAIASLPKEGQNEADRKWLQERIIKILAATTDNLEPQKWGEGMTDDHVVHLIQDLQVGLQLLIPALNPEAKDYQIISVHELIVIPEELQGDLDRLVRDFGFFLGRHYNVSHLIEEYIFEAEDHKAIRATKIQELMSPLLVTLSEALDLRREQKAMADQAAHRSAKEEALEVQEETGKPLVKPQPEAQHWSNIDEMRRQLRDGEQTLRDVLGAQFFSLVQDQQQWIKGFVKYPDEPAEIPEHQILSRLPAPESAQEQLADEAYRALISISTFHHLNPKALIFSIIQNEAHRRKENIHAGDGEYAALRELPNMPIHKLLSIASPAAHFLEVLKKRGLEDSQLGRLAQAAHFSPAKKVSQLAVMEGMIRESMQLPDQDISFEDQIKESGVLNGAKPTTEDILCRIILHLHECLTRGGASTSFNITGLFWRMLGSQQEVHQWVKPGSGGQMAPRASRAQWLAYAFQYFSSEEDEELQSLARTFFGACSLKTKQQWGEKYESGKSSLDEIREFARLLPYSEDTVKALREELGRAELQGAIGAHYAPKKIYHVLQMRKRRCLQELRESQKQNPGPVLSESGRVTRYKDRARLEARIELGKNNPVEFLRQELQDAEARLEDIKKFTKAFDKRYKPLKKTISELSEATPQELDKLGDVVSAFWHETLMTSFPIIFSLFRQDPRFRRRLARIMRMEDVQDSKLLDLLNYLQEKVGLTLPDIHPFGKIDALVIRGLKKNNKVPS